MKSILLFLLATTFFTLPLRADEDFPTVGRSYKVFYATKPDAAAFSPDVVRILQKGSGNWVFVEAKKGPDAVKASFWLNCDWLLSADEIDENDSGVLSELEKAIADQTAKVEQRKKVLDEIVKNKNLVDKGSGAAKPKAPESSAEEAIRKSLDAQDYVDAKKDFENDQELLRQMKLKLASMKEKK
jgi:hypothetical protein